MGVIASAPPAAPRACLIDAAFRIVPCRGESRSGDAALVRRDGDWALFAVVDALGHGAKAADVADLAIVHLDQVRFAEREVGEIVAGLGDALRGTRGAAGLVCLWHAPTQRLSGCGVGNVELRAVGTRVSAPLSPGVLGAPIRRLQRFEATLHAPTTIFLCSDGVSSRISLQEIVVPGLDAVGLCDSALAVGRKEHDDAAVLVARFQDRIS